MKSSIKFEDLSSSVLGRLKKLGINRWFDLILHFPIHYQNETCLSTIAKAQVGVEVVLLLTVTQQDISYRPRKILRLRCVDDSGAVTLSFFNFHAGYLKQYPVGTTLRAFGELSRGVLGCEMIHPKLTVVSECSALPTQLTPVYSTVIGLSQSVLRRLVVQALGMTNEFPDLLPKNMMSAYDLEAFGQCIQSLHYPPPACWTQLPALIARQHPLWHRIQFEELLVQQLAMHKLRQMLCHGVALVFADRPGGYVARLLASLPFELTAAQDRAWQDIRADLKLTTPMRRLLQGDVGCGKTIVAALAIAQALDAGAQAALMVPTELLVEQHLTKFLEWFEPLGVCVSSLVSGGSAVVRRRVLNELQRGDIDILIGTHAVFSEDVVFKNLALMVIDEQHRFGVSQRLALWNKGKTPHQLMMSATPIPRTLSMTYYADLTVSVIDALPPGRTPVQTALLPSARRGALIERLAHLCDLGAQAYWVCPLIDESDKVQLQAAEVIFAELSVALPRLKVGLLHGRLKKVERVDIMTRFRANQIHVLVATTVIEVGVDVPNASVMIIENAERFGLAQLHQLRGRVGRGVRESHCILLYDEPLSVQAKSRLMMMKRSHDGFEIARCDLDMRGPGEFLGARQSGVAMLRFASIDQADDVDASRSAAQKIWLEMPEYIEPLLQRWLCGQQLFGLA